MVQPIRLDPSEIWEVRLCELSYYASQQHLQLLNLNVFVNALMYCDIIAQQLICTAKVRCVRSFRIVQTYYDSEYSFQNVYYVPVERRTFRDIRIEILNLSGKLIPFNDSQTTLKAVLYFRRVVTH